MRSPGFSARSRASRAGGIAILLLWSLLSLVSGATQALCLDLGGDCAAPGSAAGSCHADPAESDLDPGCGSCVDILVPDEASARSDRPEHDVRAAVAAHAPVAVTGALPDFEIVVPATAAPPGGSVGLHRSIRTTVLLI